MMKKFDWKTPIDLNLFILRIVGLWPKGEELYKLDFYLAYVVSAAIFLVGGFNASQIINIYYIFTDFEALTSSVLLTSTNILAVLKMYLFVKNLKVIKGLLAMLNTSPYQPKTDQEMKLISPSLKRWKRIYLWYNTVVVFNLLMWSVAPLVSGSSEFRLPFDAWFPFSTKVSPNYQLAYIYQIICMWPMSLCNINLDCIIMALMLFIWVQCDLICYGLKTLKNDSTFQKDIIAYIKRHKGILSFAKTSNDFFQWIILGQFATSTAVIALIMFQLTLVSPMSGQGLAHIFYIHGITTQIYLYCWFGNQVEIKSSRILYAVFESNWICQPLSFKKNVLILCIRCMKPIRITAINLFTLSLQTFILIIRSAYSYFALLSNVNSE